MRLPSTAVVLLILFGRSAPAQTPLLPNAGFEEGVGATPGGWQLSGGTGSWERTGHTGGRSVSVTGDGTESNLWRSGDLALTPRQTCRVSMWMRVAPGTAGGCIVTGPSFANRDYSAGEQWEERDFVFVAPDDPAAAFLRFGQWMVKGRVFFDDVHLVPVEPIHRLVSGMELGAGEAITGGTYSFRSDFGSEGSNYARPLFSNQCGFNSNRWTVTTGASVTYRHRVEGHAQRSASIKVNVGYYQSGKLVVEASRDGKAWLSLGETAAVGMLEAKLPAELFPAEETYVRFTGADAANLQVYGYEYSADLEANPPDTKGTTAFFELLQAPGNIHIASAGDLTPGGENHVVILAGPTALPQGGVARVRVRGDRSDRTTQVRVQPRMATVRVPYEVRDTGPQTIEVSVLPPGGDQPLFAAQARFAVADLYKSDFGYALPSDETAALWWAEGPYKVSRERPLPEAAKPAVEVEAARDEYEPVQLVLRPAKDLARVQARATDLKGPGNARIPADAIDISAVDYVSVRIPTDDTGCEGSWPDPLPPAREAFTAKGGQNQPLWITVHVPKDAGAGRYEGSIELSAADWKRSVPLRVRVFDFALPDETHVQSGFGLDSGAIRAYHNLETNEEVRQVFDLYLQDFAAHRICPYDPMQLSPMKIEFTGLVWWGGEVVRDTKHSGEASLKVVDDSTTSPIDAHLADLIPIDPAKPYTIRWACKTTEPGQQYLVTVGCHDANRTWISGHNIDLAATGTGEWKVEERDITGRFAPEARFASITLRPAMWTEDGSNTGTAWFDDVELWSAPGPNLIPDPGFEQGLGEMDVKIDFGAWDKAAERAFNELHMNSFALPVQGMGGGTFHSRYYGSIGPYKQGTPEYERLMTKYLGLVTDHLAEKGWLDKQYVYWFDEPEPRDYDFVKEGMALLKRCGPKVRRMLTEEPIEPLFGSVDLWCPVVPNMDPVACAERQRAGDQIWWYVCTGPKAPYTTLFIDHNAIEMRMWLWMTWKWNIQGVLVWATNYWTSPCAYPAPKLQNPWEDPMSYVSGYDLPVGHIGYWGNGDGRFLYPPNRKVGEDKTKHLGGPVNCIRWEMLRDGIEDYEYLYLLRSLVERAQGEPAAAEAAKLLAIPEEIVTDKTHFTRDPQPLLAHRRKVAEAIERLGRP
jgi:Glycoside hydrolase 123, catalytic domain/Glycoside hydrolase 123 N-terminal domain